MGACLCRHLFVCVLVHVNYIYLVTHAITLTAKNWANFLALVNVWVEIWGWLYFQEKIISCFFFIDNICTILFSALVETILRNSKNCYKYNGLV